MMNRNLLALKIWSCLPVMVVFLVYLTHEASRFIMVQGVAEIPAYAIAAAIEGLCIFLAVQRGLSRFLAIFLIVGFMIYASSITRISDVNHYAFVSKVKLDQLAAYDSQILHLTDEIEKYEDKGWPKNALAKSKIRDVIVEKRNSLSESISEDTGIQSQVWGHISWIVLLRLICSVGNLIIAHSMKRMIYDYFELREPAPKVKLSEKQEKFTGYLRNKGGQAKWEQIVKSGVFRSAEEGDRIISELEKLCQIQVHRNGHKLNNRIELL